MSQAGWYPDPASPAAIRWWDGRAWTDAVRPGGPGGFGGLDPAADRSQEANAGRWAKRALFAGAAAYCGQYVLAATVYRSFFQAYRNWLHTSTGPNGTGAPLVLPHGFVAVDLLSSLISMALIVVGVVFLIWFEKAATVAQRAGIPARRSPGWAVGGWFIPIVNWWFPYQSGVDVFPPGHPGGHLVKRWWALWLVAQFSSVVVTMAAVASAPVGWVFAVAATAVTVGAATAGGAVIDEVDRVHAGLLGR